MVQAGRPTSGDLWGPPGTGKTAVARLLAETTDLHFEQLSAIQSGVADLRKVFDAAKAKREAGRGTLLFIDEIHRFNRSQQDAFLPHMEDGTIVLVGATTENIIRAQLGASVPGQRFDLPGGSTTKRWRLIQRAEAHEGRKLPLDPDARQTLISMADAAMGAGSSISSRMCFSRFLPTRRRLWIARASASVQRRADLRQRARRPLQPH